MPDSFRTSRVPYVHEWIHNMHPPVVCFTTGNPHATRVRERDPPLCEGLRALSPPPTGLVQVLM